MVTTNLFVFERGVYPYLSCIFLDFVRLYLILDKICKYRALIENSC